MTIIFKDTDSWYWTLPHSVRKSNGQIYDYSKTKWFARTGGFWVKQRLEMGISFYLSMADITLCTC